MKFFVYSLLTYAAKNRACLKLVDWIKQFEYMLIQDEVSLDALKFSIEERINQINSEHRKLKQIVFGYYVSDGTIQISARVMTASGTPDQVFIMSICRVKGIFQFSEKNTPKLDVKKGGQQ